MNWQDIVLMVATFCLAAVLMVSIIRKIHLPLGTSLPSVLALTVMGGVLLTLGLYLTASASFLNAICWYILVLRRKR